MSHRVLPDRPARTDAGPARGAIVTSPTSSSPWRCGRSRCLLADPRRRPPRGFEHCENLIASEQNGLPAQIPHQAHPGDHMDIVGLGLTVKSPALTTTTTPRVGTSSPTAADSNLAARFASKRLLRTYGWRTPLTMTVFPPTQTRASRCSFAFTVKTPAGPITRWSMSAPFSPMGTECRNPQLGSFRTRAANWSATRRSPMAPNSHEE